MKQTENLPLVSIICTVFNHAEFVIEALDAILKQDYPSLELILVDNGSEDYSRKKINQWVKEHLDHLPIKTVYRNRPLPYCKSFNKAFRIIQGKYFIDYAGDDVMHPDHITKSVLKLESNIQAAICFSDAYFIGDGKNGETFYKRDKKGKLKQKVSQGEMYQLLVAKHALLSVTMVVRSDFFQSIGLYDEYLVYEDFDIMVRMARKHPFVFSDHIGISKRLHEDSMSAGQYRSRNSVMLPSTLMICKKIKLLNQNKEEDKALLKRVMYESKHALWSANFKVAAGFLELAEMLGAKSPTFYFFKKWLKYEWDVSDLYEKMKS